MPGELFGMKHGDAVSLPQSTSRAVLPVPPGNASSQRSCVQNSSQPNTPHLLPSPQAATELTKWSARDENCRQGSFRVCLHEPTEAAGGVTRLLQATAELPPPSRPSLRRAAAFAPSARRVHRPHRGRGRAAPHRGTSACCGRHCL